MPRRWRRRLTRPRSSSRRGARHSPAAGRPTPRSSRPSPGPSSCPSKPAHTFPDQGRRSIDCTDFTLRSYQESDESGEDDDGDDGGDGAGCDQTPFLVEPPLRVTADIRCRIFCSIVRHVESFLSNNKRALFLFRMFFQRNLASFLASGYKGSLKGHSMHLVHMCAPKC